MSLRAKSYLYLLFVHILLAAVAAALLWEHPGWLFPVEAVFLLSATVGVRAVRGLSLPVDLARTGSELMAEGDFTSKFTRTGHTDLDGLLDIYNSMIDRLRQERIAVQEQSYLLERILRDRTIRRPEW